MKIFKSLAFLMLVCSIFIIACKPKDAEIKTAVEKSLLSTLSLAKTTVDVKDGIVTLGGELKSPEDKLLAETTSKSVKGVKSIVNNITVIASSLVIIEVDEVLSRSVKDAVKDYPTVTANAKDGVISLTGEINKSRLQKLISSLSALHPKKIDNKLTVK